ncbi:MAG: tetratricopeptide repeat protein [Gaiellaceae bacterium]
MRRRLLFLVTALAAAAAALLGGVLGGDPDATTAAGVRPEAAAARLLDGFAAGDTAAYVAGLERRVEQSPEDAEGLMLLGLAYQQRARETGDVSLYPLSERALRRSLALVSKNDLAVTGLAALAASRHRFGQARSLARRALLLNPYSAAALGILGDANVETGRYRAAFSAFDRMAAIKPTASAYARVSYARELLGRTAEAIAAMKLAASAASGSGDPAAWARSQLGGLYAESGRLALADREYEHALHLSPGYAPALAGLATLALWRGRADEAARLYRQALAARQLPEFAVGLGNALARDGREVAADRAYRQAEKLEDLFAANGGRNDLETALFELDHDRDLVDALARARAGRDLRPSVEGEHVLAWALFKNGRCGEARAHSVRALRLGTKDWGAMLHRSLIESCLGNGRAARLWRVRAVAANPYALAAFGPLAAHRR